MPLLPVRTRRQACHAAAGQCAVALCADEAAAEKLAETLNNTNFHAAEMPVINNVDVAVETDPAQIRDAWIRQLYSPVRWVETVQALKEQGVIRVYECGPARYLAA